MDSKPSLFKIGLEKYVSHVNSGDVHGLVEREKSKLFLRSAANMKKILFLDIYIVNEI